MGRIDLREEFIEALRVKIPKNADLVKSVAEILKIEKEPASRRINGTVMFSIREMGLLASEFGISVDRLILKSVEYESLPMIMKKPQGPGTVDSFSEFIQESMKEIRKIRSADSEYMAVFNYMPFEMYMNYDNLMKFMFFRWGHYFVGTDEFYDFGSWRMPQSALDLKEECMRTYSGISKVTYIWDDSLIWLLVREIENFANMHIISAGDREGLKSEIFRLLQDVENFAKFNVFDPYKEAEIYLYVSNTPLGMNSWCHTSDKGSLSFVWTNFMWSPITDNHRISLSLKEWITSLLGISTLVSGSGHKERRIFFEGQREIVRQMMG